MPKTADDQATQAQRISRRIQRLLKGLDPGVQSAILADLLSLWLAGHWPPEAREELLTTWIEHVRYLVPLSEQELFGPLGHPAGREQP